MVTTEICETGKVEEWEMDLENTSIFEKNITVVKQFFVYLKIVHLAQYLIFVHMDFISLW